MPRCRLYSLIQRPPATAPAGLLLALLLVLAWPGTWPVSGATATAQSGDGIYRLLERHGYSGAKYFDEFIELNHAKLGPNNTLYQGREYQLPSRQGLVTEPLFGPKLAKVRVLDRRLAGAAFYLVSGHGGPDPGGLARVAGHTLAEDEYAYDVTLRLGRCLLEHGARVHFIIRDPQDGIRDARYLKSDKSEVCDPTQKIPLNQVARLRQRTQAVNRLYRNDTGVKYRRCVVLHVDARRQHEKIDIFFYHHAASRRGKQLAEGLRDTLERKYRINQPDRGYTGTVSPRSLYIINETEPPVVFIELGNIHHPRDQQRLIEPNNRQAVANWLCEGILTDYKKCGF